MDKAAPSPTNGKGSVGGDRAPRTNASPTLGKGKVTHPCWGLGPVSLCGGSTAKMERGTQRTKLGVCHTLGAGARCVRVVGVSRGHAAHRSVRLSPEETRARSGGRGQCGGDRGRAGQGSGGDGVESCSRLRFCGADGCARARGPCGVAARCSFSEGARTFGPKECRCTHRDRKYVTLPSTPTHSPHPHRPPDQEI